MTNDAKVRDPLSLWVVPVADLGGVARHVLDVAHAGIPGYRLAVLCPEGPLVQRLREAGVQVAVGDFGPGAGFLRSVRALRTAVARLRPVVVHSHLAYADIIVAAAPLCRQVMRVTTEHGIAGDDRVYHVHETKSRFMAAVHRARLRRFDAAIAVSEATKGAMTEKWSPKLEVQVILNGVDPVEESDCRASRSPRILALARLSPEKRLPQLLEAFRRVLEEDPEAHLCIAGVGELELELKRLSSQLGLAHAVDFPGFVDPDSAMSEADVLAQLSAWENCSYTLLDAANRGMRVVASDVGGNPEIVDARGLVDADDVPAVAHALLDRGAVTRLSGWPTVADMTKAVANVYGGRVPPVGKPTKHVTIATNNGDIGGGEVMLLNIAEALTSLGVRVTVVGPSSPNGLVSAARKADLETVELQASTRFEWMRALRTWDKREREGILWCNGLVPAFATSGHRDRVVHLHQRPVGAHKLMSRLARRGALSTLVPSESMASVVSGARVLPNWSSRVETDGRARQVEHAPLVLGFLGRFSVDKGVDVLANAMAALEAEYPGEFRLRMAGEPRFVGDKSRRIVERALDAVSPLVEFTGWVPRDQFLASIDLLVVPSVWEEPFGLVVTEAMSARVPVIVSNAGALPDVLGEEPDVFAAGDSRALARAIVEKRERGVREAVERNFERWLTHFSQAAARGALSSLLSALEPGSTVTVKRS